MSLIKNELEYKSGQLNLFLKVFIFFFLIYSNKCNEVNAAR